MNKQRLGAIFTVLAQNEWITAPQLAKMMRVTTRTIWRDIDVLNKAGVPIVTHRGVGGGISLPPDFKNIAALAGYEAFIESMLNDLANSENVVDDEIASFEGASG